MKFANKIKTAASNPAMFAAYSRWIAARVFLGKAPDLFLSDGTRIGGWATFSEFWSFKNIIKDMVLDHEVAFMKRCLSNKINGGTAFDIGANVGIFTCLIARTGPHSVHAFEPIPETFCRLQHNVKTNGFSDRCRLNCLAVGRGRDLVTFRVQENTSETSHMTVNAAKTGGEATGTQVVSVIDLDGYCQSQKIEFIDYLKIDVEGMEPHVLEGARGLLKNRKIAAAMIEICPANLRNVGLSPSALYREFEESRYSPHVLQDDGTLGEKLALAQIETISLINAVLLPDP